MTDAQNQIIGLLKEIKAESGGGGGAVNWGAILGTLANQTDLNDALALKQTAAQVQALIAAAVAGKGVIGIVRLTGVAGDTVSNVAYADGPFPTGGGTTYDFVSASGQLTITFGAALADGNYVPSVAVDSGTEWKYLQADTGQLLLRFYDGATGDPKDPGGVMISLLHH